MADLNSLTKPEIDAELEFEPINDSAQDSIGEFDAADPGGEEEFYGTVNEAVARVESRGDHQAYNHGSGAFGLMQVMKETAGPHVRDPETGKIRLIEKDELVADDDTIFGPGFGVQPLPLDEVHKDPSERDPKLWAQFGRDYLRGLLDHFQDLDTALVAYNAGPTQARRWVLRGANPEDPKLPKETRDYIKKVRRRLTDPEMSVRATQGLDPAKESEYHKLADEVDLPPTVIREDPAAVRLEQQAKSAAEARDTHPATSSLMADPEDAVRVKDDIEALKKVEDSAKNASFWQSASSSVDTVQAFMYNGVEVLGQISGIEGLEIVGREGSEANIAQAEAAIKGRKQIQFTDIESLDDLRVWFIQSAGSQGVMMAPGAIGGMVGAGVGMLGGPFAPVSVPLGVAIGTFIPSFILGVGETQQAIEEKGGKAPLHAIGGGALIGTLDSMLPGKIGSRIARAFGREAAEKVIKNVALRVGAKTLGGATLEGVTEAVQEGISEGAAALGTKTSVNLRDLGLRMVNAFAVGMMMGGATSGATETAAGVVESRRAKARMDKLDAAVKETKTAERNPDLSDQHKAEVIHEGGLDEVHVDAKSLLDAVSKSDLDSVETLGKLGVLDQMEEAIRTDGKVTLSGEAFATEILGKDIYQDVAVHMTFTKEGPSVSDAVAPLAEPAMQESLTSELESYQAAPELAERVQKLIEGFASGDPVNVLDAAQVDEQAVLLDLIGRVESRKQDITDVEVASRVEFLDQELKRIDQGMADTEALIEQKDKAGLATTAVEKKLEKLKDAREKAIREQISLEEPGIVASKVRDILGRAVDPQKKVTTRAGTLQRLNVKTNKATVRAAKQGFNKGFSTGVAKVQEAKGFLIDALAKADVPLKKFRGFLKSIKTLEQLQKKQGAIQQRMNLIIDDARKKQLREAMDKTFKAYKVKRQSGKPVGKLTADGQQIVDRLATSFNLSKENAAQALEANLGKMEFGDTIEHALDPISALEMQIQALKADSRSFNADTVEDMLIDLQGIIAGEKSARAQSLLGEAIRTQEMKTFLESPEGMLPIGQVKRRGTKFFQKAVDTFGTFGYNGVWHQKLRHLIQSSDKALVDKVTNEELSLFDENQKYRRGLNQRQEDFTARMVTALGITEKEFRKKVSTDTYAEVDLGQIILGTGEVQTRKFTKSELRYIEMINRHPKLREVIQHLESNAFTEEILTKVSNEMDSQDNIIIDEMIKDFDEYYDSINEVYRDLYGVDLPKEEFYFPTSRVSGETEQASEFLKGALVSYRGGVTGRALKSRVENNNPFGIQGDFAVWDAHLHEMEYFKAYAKKVRFLNGVFNGRLMKQLELKQGRKPVTSLRQDLDAFARRGETNASAGMGVVRTLARNFAGAQLGGKPQIGFKQMLSQFVFIEGLTTKEFSKGLAEFYANPAKAWKFLNENSDFFKDRGMGIDVDFQDFLKDPGVFKQHGVALKKHMFLAIQLGDKFAIAAGGYARYRALIAKGMSHEKAIRNFAQLAEQTQQSPSVDQQTQLQRGGWGRLFTMFMTSHNAIARAQWQAMKEFKKGRLTTAELTRMLVVTHIIIPQAMQFAANGLHWDKEDQLLAGLTGSLTGFFIIGEALEQVATGILNAADIEKEFWESPGFNPVFALTEFVNGLAAIGTEGITWDDFVFGSQSLDSILKGASAYVGLNITQLVNSARGFWTLTADPEASPEEKKAAGFVAVGGYSPYIANEKVLGNPYSDED
jgi:hypothetical protein